MKKLLLGFILLFCAQFANATTRYVAQSAGTVTCAGGSHTAITVATFNSTTLSPGDTTYFCGTITAPGGSSNYIQISQSGTAGNLLTFIFDTGAIITAPYWQNGGAISLGANNYILINGGTNGIIQATANGTALANHVDGGVGIYSPGATSNVEIENLTISNLYVRTLTTDENVDQVYGIDVWGGSNIKIHNNVIHDAVWDILVIYGTGATTSTNFLTYNNTLYNMDHGIIYGDQTGGSKLTSSNCDSAIYNNDISNMGVWDDTVPTHDDYHHDGIHVWANSSGGTSSYSGVCAYSNYVHGNNGAYCNTGIGFEASNGGHNYAFNNVIDFTGTNSTCATGALGWFTGSGNNGLTPEVFNNTIRPGSNTLSNVNFEQLSGAILENNLLGSNMAVYIGTDNGPSGTISTANYNVYQLPEGASGFNGPPACLDVSFSVWQSGCSFDLNGAETTITFNSDNTLPMGSPAISGGVNLTSLGITALDTGAPQTFGANGACGTGCLARMSTGTNNWDRGAYPYTSTLPPVQGVGIGIMP